MIILTLRTDNPMAEIGLFEDKKQIAYETWEAHRRLAETLHIKLKELLETNKKSWKDVEGIVVFAGPGSFTGLRIGIATANALAYANGISITATGNDNWKADGIEILKINKGQKTVVPEYGMPAHITTPKK